MIGRLADIILRKTSSRIRNMMFFLCFAVVFLLASDCFASDECPDLETLQKKYMNGCVPCQVVKVLLTAFMRASANVYDVSREAGTKLLLIGSAIWVAFWALKKVSSFTNPEPMAMMNELLIFFGKVLVAFVFINSGIGTLIGYAVNPVIAAGADYGTALISAGASSMAHPIDLTAAPEAKNAYSGPTDIVSKKVMDKILRFSEAASYEVTNNMIIGSALSCFAVQKGIHWKLIIEIHIPDIWLWLCGAAIWIIGFLLTLAVCYYLVDIPFKLGFAIIALPVVIGLWPFKITQGKLKAVIMIAVNAAGTFLFLSLAVAYAMVLISAALQDKEKLFEAFKQDDVTYVENLFAITGPHFIIILFCYIYGFKMIGEISKKMPNKFFGGSMTASAGSPIHHMTTAATDWLKKKAMAPVKMATDIIANQAGKAATTVTKAAGNVGIGMAAYGVGAVGRGLGKGTSFIGRKMANAGRNAQEGFDAEQRMGARNNSAYKQFGLGFKSQLSGAFAKTGELMDRAGKKGDDLSKTLQNPLNNTFARIGDAAKASGKEWKEAVKDFADVDATWDRVSEQEDARLEAQKERSRKASGKVAAYAPIGTGDAIQAVGTALRKYENTDSSNVIKKVASKFAGAYGKHLERKGAFIAQNVAEEGTHRAQIRKAFILEASPEGAAREHPLAFAWRGLAAGGKSLGKGFIKDWGKVTKHAKILSNSVTEFGNNYIDTLDSNSAQAADSLAGLGNALKNAPKKFAKDADKIVDSVLQDITDHSDINGQFISTLKDSKARAKVIAKNIAKNLDPLQNTYNEGMASLQDTNGNPLETTIGLTAGVTKGIVKDVGNLALSLPAAALGLGIMGKDVANTAVEGAYSATMHAAFAGIDAAKLATAPLTSAVKTAANITGHLGASALDLGKTTINVMAVGQIVNVGAGVLNTAGALAKVPVKTILRAAGGITSFGFSVVDNTLYAAYRSTVTPTLAVGNAALQGIGVGYRALSATTLGKGIRTELHIARNGLKVGLRTIQIGTSIIKAAAGKGPNRPARKLTPQERAQRDAERKRREEEEKKREAERRRERERQIEAEKQKLLDDLRRQMENERQRHNDLRNNAKDEFNRRVSELQNEMLRRLADAPSNERQNLRTTLKTEYDQRVSEIRNELLNQT